MPPLPHWLMISQDLQNNATNEVKSTNNVSTQKNASPNVTYIKDARHQHLRPLQSSWVGAGWSVFIPVTIRGEGENAGTWEPPPEIRVLG